MPFPSRQCSGSGTRAVGACAGYPRVLVPAGYTAGQGAAEAPADAAGNRRPISTASLGQVYQEPALLGLASDDGAVSMLRRPPSELNPACSPARPGRRRPDTLLDDRRRPGPARRYGSARRRPSVRRGAGCSSRPAWSASTGPPSAAARVGLCTRARGTGALRLSRILVTGKDGLAEATFRPTDDVRWYVADDASTVRNADATVRSAGGLVQLKR